MKILTIYANPNPKSFCHAILEQFTQSLEEASHTNEVVDLYAMKFNPVLKARDYPNWIDEKIPLETLKRMILENSGGPIQRFALERWLRNKEVPDILKAIKRLRPKDVVEQQQKVAQAQGLAIISPVWFVGFPAILKGWIERVFTYGFAYSLTPEGWKGDIHGRIPLFKHEKALLISTTLFNEEAYQAGLREAMTRLIDDFGFRYPGVKNVEHVYFYSVSAVGEEVRQGYLQETYRLGKEFCSA
ncbi:MAG: NAD(P)H dehydrogenase [Chloroflexi bacterium RBG_16_57_11]|nr:MAG: NAD(P)H dehydrogenase [Chloroflexi bacterium RBG_16_57_11]